MKKIISYIYIIGINGLASFSKAFADKGFWDQDKTYYPDVPGAKTNTISSDTAALESKILPKIQNFINRALGLLAFISLVILLIAGFKMLLNANDDGEQKKAMGVVKNVAIALIFIGCSRLIISGIFRLVDVITK